MRSRAEIRQAAAQGDAAAQFQVQLAQGYVDYQDYEEFVGNYYLEIGDDPGELRGDEEDQLMLFYTMLSSLRDDSDGFNEALDTLWTEDERFDECTDEDEEEREEKQREIRADIKDSVELHVEHGLERCGTDRSEVRVSCDAIDERLSEYVGMTDDIGEGCDADDIAAEAEEIRALVEDVSQQLRASSWFEEWEKHTYALAPFATCLRHLRSLHEKQIDTLTRRVEEAL